LLQTLGLLDLISGELRSSDVPLSHRFFVGLLSGAIWKRKVIIMCKCGWYLRFHCSPGAVGRSLLAERGLQPITSPLAVVSVMPRKSIGALGSRLKRPMTVGGWTRTYIRVKGKVGFCIIPGLVDFGAVPVNDRHNFFSGQKKAMQQRLSAFLAKSLGREKPSGRRGVINYRQSTRLSTRHCRGSKPQGEFWPTIATKPPAVLSI